MERTCAKREVKMLLTEMSPICKIGIGILLVVMTVVTFLAYWIFYKYLFYSVFSSEGGYRFVTIKLRREK